MQNTVILVNSSIIHVILHCVDETTTTPGSRWFVDSNVQRVDALMKLLLLHRITSLLARCDFGIGNYREHRNYNKSI